MVKVNQNKCTGCGLCVSICPEVFKINSDGKAEAKPGANAKCAKEAAENCPVEAIK